MSNPEFEREFDIEYNNIMSNAAPSIDAYEKSVFLTKAQEEIVIAIYDGSFENTEKLTECIDTLVISEDFDSTKDQANADPTWKIDTKHSRFFELGNKALFITYEELVLKEKDKCGNEVKVLVKPTKQDEYYRICRNPFRRARKNEALRLNAHGLIEIVSIYDYYTYRVRYLKKPDPIVLYTEPGLTIDGVAHNTPCKLPEVIHRMILDRAVQLAAQAYKAS